MSEKQVRSGLAKDIERWERVCGVQESTPNSNSEVMERLKECTDADPYVMKDFTQESVPGKGGQYSSFSVFDCGEDIAVELPFKPDRGLDEGVQEDWHQAITETWDRAFELEDSDGSRHDLRVLPTFDPDAKDANVNPIRSTDASGGDMYNWPTEDGARTRGEVAAHEVGHFLLAPDTYDLYGERAFTQLVGRMPTAEEHDGVRDGDGNLRYDESNSMMSDYGAVRASQLEKMHGKIVETRGIDSTLIESPNKSTPAE